MGLRAHHGVRSGAGQPDDADVLCGKCRHTPEGKAVEAGSAGLLLDLRAVSEEESLRLLALSAVSTVAGGAGYAVDGAVSLARRGQTPVTSGNSERAIGLARWDQGNGDGPVSQALAGKLAIIANDYSRDTRWPGYWRPIRDASYRSVLSVPLPLEPGGSAALTLLAEKTNAFTPAVMADVMSFSRVAASSYLMATEVREALAAAGHLRTAMQGRTAIDVTCGVIMGQNRCSHEEAFKILATASSHATSRFGYSRNPCWRICQGESRQRIFKG